MFTALDADPERLDQHEQDFLTRGGRGGFMATMISIVSSLCFRIEAESFRGRQDRQRISELLNLI
jgi:hypothetical protein